MNALRVRAGAAHTHRALSRDARLVWNAAPRLQRARPEQPSPRPTMCDAAAAAPPGAADGSSIASVRGLLDGLLRVTLNDNRVLIGRFSCFDKQRNVLLGETWEQRFTDGVTVPSPPRKPDFERNLGLVLVPRQHILSVHAIDPDEYA